MNEISCNVIKDLLPLYNDEVVSEDSRQLIEGHLKMCESCKREYELLHRSLILPMNRSVVQSEAKTIKKLKQKVSFRRLAMMLATLLLVVSIIAGWIVWLATTQTVIPYDPQKITVSVAEYDNQFYIDYSIHADAQLCYYSHSGSGKQILIICFQETRLNALMGKKAVDCGSKVFPNGGVDAVYYGDFTSSDDPMADLSEYKLIWKSSEYQP